MANNTVKAVSLTGRTIGLNSKKISHYVASRIGWAEVDKIASVVKEIEGRCNEHGAYPATVTKIGVHELRSSCPVCDENRELRYQEIQRRRRQEELRQRIERNRRDCALPRRFADCTFDGFLAENQSQQAALAIARGFAERFCDMQRLGASLTFCGPPGTGKTHLCAAVANHLVPQGNTVLYRQSYAVLREIKDTWHKNSTRSEGEVIRRLSGVDLLIIDEIGVQFGSESEKILMFEVLDGRYQACKPTVICSNLGRKALGEFLGERILDRLLDKGSSIIVCDWESYRRRA